LQNRRYVLITAARNEDAFIEQTLSSVAAQSIRPTRWVVISDGSTDRTERIVAQFALRWGFMELLRAPQHRVHSFRSKVNAVNLGLQAVRTDDYDFLGILDADIRLKYDYFERIIERFERDPHLGLGGGEVYEERNGTLQARFSNRNRSVAGAIQFFRRECHDQIGEFISLPHGGEDWCAEVSARMQGWRVESFPELPVIHLRPTGTANGLIRYRFRQGLTDYLVGSDPIFEVGKLGCRVREVPYVIGATARLLGFLAGFAGGRDRPVSQEFVAYIRKEQRSRIRNEGIARLRSVAAATDLPHHK
jgi:glycosyltransferase involved in cell wall biosynthesis